jgi:hypothetical protein
MNISAEQYFYCTDGAVFKTIDEFVQSLKTMPESVFAYHVNQEKNDFANWMQGVFQELSLAEALRKCHSKKEMIDHFEKQKKNMENIQQIAEFIEKLNEKKINKEEKKVIQEYKKDDLKKEGSVKQDIRIEPNTVVSELTEEPKETESTMQKPAVSQKNGSQMQIELLAASDTMIETQKKAVSELRKTGKDVFMCQIYLEIIPSKQKLAHLTNDPKDIELLGIYVERLRSEIEYSRDKGYIDLHKEIEQLTHKEEVA